MCVSFFRVGESGEWDSSNAILTSDNGTSWQVIGLQPYTVYSFRIVAVNTIGDSRPSKESYYMVTLREGKLICTSYFILEMIFELNIVLNHTSYIVVYII